LISNDVKVFRGRLVGLTEWYKKMGRHKRLRVQKERREKGKEKEKEGFLRVVAKDIEAFGGTLKVRVREFTIHLLAKVFDVFVRRRKGFAGLDGDRARDTFIIVVIAVIFVLSSFRVVVLDGRRDLDGDGEGGGRGRRRENGRRTGRKGG